MIGQLSESGHPHFINILCRRFVELPVYTLFITELFQRLQIQQSYRFPVITTRKRVSNCLLYTSDAADE